MSVEITGMYLGNKKVKLIHGPSGTSILTDAPKDNRGEGKSFSPSDLVGGAFGSCMMTIMAIHAERENIDLTGAHFRLEKIMSENPRRIASLPIVFHLPGKLSGEQRQKLENVAPSCPVCCSLSPEIEAKVQFIYDI